MTEERETVETVWLWRYNISAFRAVYGRLDGTKYTKDFLQSSGECAAHLVEEFGHDVALELVWPGGGSPGRTLAGADDNPPDRRRQLLGWWEQAIPAPWAMYAVGDENWLKTFEGNPNLTDERAADAQWAQFDPGQGTTTGWLVAVKLAGEENRLHLRAYLENPPTHLAHTDFELVPEVIRSVARDLASNVGCCVVKPPRVGNPVRAASIVSDVLDALDQESCVLLTGPPGTGKTVALEDIRSLWEVGFSQIGFDPSRLHDAWAEDGQPPEGLAKHVVFHPSYSYDEFVLGLYPKTGPGGGIELEARPGPLLSLAHWASSAGNNALLIIDEFNRGNAAGIFGDCLALLDRAQRADPDVAGSGASIDRAHPEMPVVVAPELAGHHGRDVATQIQLPSSLKILAALNSSDRSVAPLDAAVRRRFAIVRVLPDYDLLASHLGAAELPDGAVVSDPDTWDDPHVVCRVAVEVLRQLNGRIESLLGEDFLLGHSLFWNVAGEDVPSVLRSLCDAFDNKVSGTLRMTFADQDELLGAVLNLDPESGGASGAPSVAIWLQPQNSVAQYSPPRLRIKRLADFPESDVKKALAKLL